MGLAHARSLASRREAAQMRIGHAEILAGIDWDVIDADFVMQMWPRAASAIANVADCVAAMDTLARKHSEGLQVPIARADSTSVVDNNGASVAAHKISKLNHAVGRR